MANRGKFIQSYKTYYYVLHTCGNSSCNRHSKRDLMFICDLGGHMTFGAGLFSRVGPEAESTAGVSADCGFGAAGSISGG